MTTAQVSTAPEFFQVANGTALKEYWTQEFLAAEQDIYEDGKNINKFYFTFRIKEFYRSEEDMFGQPVTSYMLVCQRRFVSGINDLEDESDICLGEDFPDFDAAFEFATEFVIPSFKRNFNFRACPVVLIDGDF